MLLKGVIWVALGLVAIALVALAAGQLGMFRRSTPPDLGAKDGKLKPPSSTENSVSSQAGLYPDHPMRTYAAIAPIRFSGDGAAALAKVRAIVESLEGIAIVRTEPMYLHLEATSKWFKFVDDIEFLVDDAEKRIHVRAAARIGRKDFGANRARVEAIRSRYEGG
ncbi:MAG: DUF1499 domain-containing protein [Burkholderiales bacterium]